MSKSRETLWGYTTTTAALLLTVAAFLQKDLHWLLAIAWPFACVAVWSLVRSVFATRGEVQLATIMGSLLVGVALLYLHSFLKPDTRVPSGEEARLQIRNTVVPTSRNGSPALDVSFFNAGRSPATNVGHYYTLATGPESCQKKK